MKPLLVYDGDCAFCKRWVRRWMSRTGERVHYAPYQEHGLLSRLGIPLSHAKRSVQLVMPDGTRYEGAKAVFRLLQLSPGYHVIAWLGQLPVLRWIAERFYRFVASNRVLASRVDRRLAEVFNLRSEPQRYVAPPPRG